MPGEVTRFGFRLEGPLIPVITRAQDPAGLVGAEVPFSWGGQSVPASVVQVDSDDSGVVVTVEVEFPEDHDGRPPWTADDPRPG